MQDYMLLMTGKLAEWKAYSPDENQQIMAKYFAFVDMLRSKHGFVGGSALKEGGFELRRQGGSVATDGPFAETKEALNGYMIFKAENFEEALSLARQCPALTHGETVQVFALAQK